MTDDDRLRRAMADDPDFVGPLPHLCGLLADECQRLRAALSMIGQIRAVTGSAQGMFAAHRNLVDAVLAGADVRDLDEVEAMCAGKWKQKKAKRVKT